MVWWQSAEQRRCEVEAADTASVARLVRGVSMSGTLRRCVTSAHMSVGVVVAWSGGCGCWTAAKSSGAQPMFSLGGFIGVAGCPAMMMHPLVTPLTMELS